MALRFTVQYPLAHPGYDPAFLTPAAMRTFLRAADEAGFDAIAFTEHPAPSHKWVRSGGHDTLDPLAALSFAAAVTDRIQLLTYTLLLPLRNPLLLAKSIATVDVISAGRLLLGVGAGYLRSEFAALGADFAERNELFDESVEAMLAAFAQEDFAFEGRHFKAIGQTIRPRPLQQPHPPIWVGGNSRIARRRAARYGAAWMPLLIGEGMGQVVRTAPIPDAAALEAAVDDLRELEAEAGRAPGSVDVQVEGLCGQMEAPPDLILERLGEVAAAGATWVVLDPPGKSVATAVESLQRYAEEIVPTVR